MYHHGSLPFAYANSILHMGLIKKLDEHFREIFLKTTLRVLLHRHPYCINYRVSAVDLIMRTYHHGWRAEQDSTKWPRTAARSTTSPFIFLNAGAVEVRRSMRGAFCKRSAEYVDWNNDRTLIAASSLAAPSAVKQYSEKAVNLDVLSSRRYNYSVRFRERGARLPQRSRRMRTKWRERPPKTET